MADQPPIDRQELMIMRAMYDAGFKACAEELGLIKPYISLNMANRKYGRQTVRRWADEGLITVIKDGNRTSTCRIRRTEIESVAAMSNRASWHEHHE